MNWKAVARSEIGTGHQKQGIVCQDYGNYCSFGDVIVGAITDGAGSAKHSDVGSRLAVETVLKCFSDINEFPHKQDSQPLDKEEAQKVFAKSVNQVIKDNSS
ncbi:protein phosphatase 2C domain-containing protein [Nostoc sp.]|uniref:protein phosphatase 2C domain-containing protein n=1 Tax=Nostoc sp. TaxID=1180 RepID=UPI002FF68763